ncbi:MAG: amino acid--tRNA ligase-related protein [Verrucomicrobiota bacterium]
MDETNSLVEQRKTKLAALRAKGINPFANKFSPKEKCAEARANYVEGREVALAGRITAHREMGKSMFIDIKDGGPPKGGTPNENGSLGVPPLGGSVSRMQIYAQKNALGDEQWNIFTHLDLGDFIGVKGTMFTTKTGEISVKLVSFVILGKALRPMPEKWHGVVDTEIRYRQRYLDLMSNDDVKETFLKRSAIVREIRNFFHGRGYVEVETPIMQGIPGGAAAQPFKTFHNALGCEFYLRIALELYHKRLLVGGIDKFFEIGKNFRNEGLSRKHNPEFTMLEAYDAFGDYETMMETVESLICHLAQSVVGGYRIPVNRNSELRQTVTSSIMKIFEGIAQILMPSYVKQPTPETTKLLNEIGGQANTNLQTLRSKIGSEFHWHLAAEAIQIVQVVEDTLRDLNKTNGAFDTRSENVIEGFRTIADVKRQFQNLATEEIIDLAPSWKRARYKSLVCEKAGDDWFDVSSQERRRRAIEDLRLGGDISAGYEDFEVTGAVFEKLVEPTLIQPTFVTHLPKELVPLAKLSDDDPTTVEVFECCINGQEISPGYTEQNDPIAQRETLEHQAGGEQQKLDEDFLVALEHGMPPAGGIGIGIDRLCMMLLSQESIRDVILFPQMKPK